MYYDYDLEMANYLEREEAIKELEQWLNEEDQFVRDMIEG